MTTHPSPSEQGPSARERTWTSCACEFADQSVPDRPTKWCAFHALLRDEAKRAQDLLASQRATPIEADRALIERAVALADLAAEHDQDESGKLPPLSLFDLQACLRDLAAALAEARKALERTKQFVVRFWNFMPNCGQLIDGLKDAPSWTAWDQQVRDELTALAKEAEKLR